MVNIKYLIRKRALGDVLWIEPVIRQLAPRFKKLVVYTKHPVLFENYPLKNVVFKKDLSFFERVLILAEKKLNLSIFTINLDDSYESRPDIHFLHAYQQKAGLPLTKEYPQLYLSEKEKNDRKVAGPYVIFHIESFSDKKFRQVYGVDWTEVVQYFISRGFKVVQVGMKSQPIQGAQVISTSIRELMSLCIHASYFIGIDSGPSHIAACFQIPSLVFFGAVNPNNRHFAGMFKGILAKKACEYDNDQAKILHEKCIACQWAQGKDMAVCSSYTTDEIISKIDQLLKP